ncbi:asparaginase [Mycena alexandri]|uniref:Asparaginase n=1 Tax=Mycena alexandri TaxID=1745969 RepID=A0AAD6SGH8_9AGAR|nr:asparaginase [Mycena alexandri]
MKFSAPFTALVVACVVGTVTCQITVQFSTTEGCNSFSDTFHGACNECFDPPGDFGSVLFSGIGSNQEVQIHNEDGCTTASLVGQGFGNACWDQGHTAIRSAFVAC